MRFARTLSFFVAISVAQLSSAETVRRPDVDEQLAFGTPPPTWAKNVGAADAEFLSSVEPASDGGAAAVGTVFNDVLLVRMDADGLPTWSRRFGGTNLELAYFVRQTADGGWIVAATTRSFGVGFEDVWVVRLDAAGNIVWQRTFGSTGADRPAGVTEIPGGGYWLVMNAGSTARVLKLDAGGAPTLQRRYSMTGGSLEFQNARLSSDGGILTGGTFNFQPPVGDPVSDAIVVKLDSTAAVTWQQRLRTGNRYGNLVFPAEAPDGGAVVLRGVPSNTGPCPKTLVKMSSTGILQWNRGIAPVQGCPRGLDAAPDGGTVAVMDDNNLSPEVIFTKQDSSGSIEWSWRYGQDISQPFSVRAAAGGGYLFGAYESLLAPGDFWVVRTDDLGATDAPCLIAGGISVSTSPATFPTAENPGIVVTNEAVSVVVTTAAAQVYTVTAGECMNADDDGDGWGNAQDNCPRVPNDQGDQDSDGFGDACDNCPGIENAGQANADGDGYGDVCDPCPIDAFNDGDADGRCAEVDNCPFDANASQLDDDGDGIGDACDFCPLDANNDDDHDYHCFAADNCPTMFNAHQRDSDADSRGDLCDNCPSVSNVAQVDSDGDGAGDPCDCQPLNIMNRRPAEVGGLRVNRAGGAVLTWSYHTGDTAYFVTRGDVAALAASSYGTCVAMGLTNQSYVDVAIPAAGHGYCYLVHAVNQDCGIGPLGYTSQELERVNTSPGACP